MANWTKRLANTVLESTSYSHLRAFAQANADAVQSVLRTTQGTRVRVVVNISSAHVPSFCDRTKANLYPAYLNTYDLEKAKARAGASPPASHWKPREVVDHALAGIHGKPMEEMYFAAADLNGTGVRFYGDVTLVLHADEVEETTLVLDRDSYDVLMPPYSTVVDAFRGHATRQYVRRLILGWLSGRWSADLPLIGATKVLGLTGARNRRFTTGQIAQALLDDEDYVEVIRHRSFDATCLDSARVSIDDVAIEADIDRRSASKRPPSHLEALWLLQRRDADNALAKAGVPRKVIIHRGRGHT